jgi:hypothetical protein
MCSHVIRYDVVYLVSCGSLTTEDGEGASPDGRGMPHVGPQWCPETPHSCPTMSHDAPSEERGKIGVRLFVKYTYVCVREKNAPKTSKSGALGGIACGAGPFDVLPRLGMQRAPS